MQFPFAELQCLSIARPGPPPPPAAGGNVSAEFQRLYSLPYEPQILSLDLWEGPLPPGMVARRGSDAHRKSLFLLRKDNCLYRHDVDTGELLDKVLNR